MATTKNPISRPVLESEVVLKTPCAQRVYGLKFKEVSRNLYSLGVVSRILANDNVADEIDAVVKQRIDEMKEALNKEIELTEAVRDENGITQLPSYTHPKTISAEVSAPRTFQYLSLVQQLDDLVTRMDSLWITDQMDSKEKLRREYMWQKRMLKLANQFRDLYNRSKAAARRQGKSIHEDEEGRAKGADDAEQAEVAAAGDEQTATDEKAESEEKQSAEATA